MFVFIEFLCLEKCRGKTRKYNKATHQLNGRRDSAITLSTRPLDFDLCLRMGREIPLRTDFHRNSHDGRKCPQEAYDECEGIDFPIASPGEEEDCSRREEGPPCPTTRRLSEIVQKH
ncbi:hypothetical protein J6590_043250 [Homalodisca vitripennis]|nr:hypothetical protein J6590_043250 [Homalodisca vitripennis]